MKYERFHLVLMVTHACNLRCDYCYTGRKFHRAMDGQLARAAIGRAVHSLNGGATLELGFFGGEPLLEAELIAELVEYAESLAAMAGVHLRAGLTTNGTLTSPAAWRVMTRPGMQLAISHDGLSETHDRHRRDLQGQGSASRVLATIRRLLDAGCDPRVVMVVRPDTAASLPDGIEHLHQHGVRHVDLTLDLWADWDRRSVAELQHALARTADLWKAGLPGRSINWFDEKATLLCGVPHNATARCGFGDGEIAVAPSGNLYPCERLIGEDDGRHPLRLPGHVLQGEDFCFSPAPGRAAESCSACAIQGQCNTTCRCSNYVRTGDIRRPDGLLCLLDQSCWRETARVLHEPRLSPRAGVEPASKQGQASGESLPCDDLSPRARGQSPSLDGRLAPPVPHRTIEANSRAEELPIVYTEKQRGARPQETDSQQT